MLSRLPNDSNIYTIIVLYHPEWSAIYSLVSELSSICAHCILVDNTPYTSDASDQYQLDFGDSVTYKRLGYNAGIGHAQNTALDYIYCSNHSPSHVLFLDQDSLISSSCVHQLFHSSNDLSLLLSRPVVVGPLVFDSKTLALRHIPKYLHGDSSVILNCLRVQRLQSSGSLVPFSLFKSGSIRFNRDLFIDYVDFDFFHQLAAIDVPVFMCYSASLPHSLGAGFLKLPFVSASVGISSPSRLYYQYKNLFILLSLPWTPKQWLSGLALRQALRLPFLIFMDSPLLRLKYCLNGLRDGLYLFMNSSSSTIREPS